MTIFSTANLQDFTCKQQQSIAFLTVKKTAQQQSRSYFYTIIISRLPKKHMRNGFF